MASATEATVWHLAGPSSNVYAFGEAADGSGLLVRFLDKNKSGPGDLYLYYVPPDELPGVLAAMADAPSKGQFVWRRLRDVYAYAKLE